MTVAMLQMHDLYILWSNVYGDIKRYNIMLALPWPKDVRTARRPIKVVKFQIRIQ